MAGDGSAIGGTAISVMAAKTPMDQKLAALLTPTIEGMGFGLVRLRLMGGARPTLQIMAERPDGGMNVDDCAELSRAVSAVLDVDDPIDGEFVLEVSSPGLDRPLTRPEDFGRFEGYEAKLELRDPLDGRKRFRGVLAGVSGAGETAKIVLESEDFGALTAQLSELADAKLVMTDALLAESLKGGGGQNGADDEQIAEDGAEIEIDETGAEGAPSKLES